MSKIQVRLNLLYNAAAGLSIFLGVMVLLGWFTNTVTLIQILPFFVPMQFNTALCFVLSGIAILQVTRGNQRWAEGCGSIVGLIALLTILEYSAGINLGLDEFFIKHNITVETSHPGRMAPNTAFCFLLSSIAALLIPRSVNAIKLSGVLGSLIFGLGLVAFTGYLIGAEVGYGWGKLTRMAVHTAFGFILLGVSFTILSWLKAQGDQRPQSIETSTWLVSYAFVIALITFFSDLKLPLGVASGLQYSVLVLFGWFFQNNKPTIILAGLATILAVIGFTLSTEGSAIWMATTNRFFTIVTIWLIALLLNSIKKKELRLIALNKDLDKKVAEANVKNKELEQFAYIASHDLQEPLRTVSSFTQLLESDYGDKFDEVGRKSLGFITSATKRMSLLIKGLLDYSRIGKDQELEIIDCNLLIEDIKEDLNARIEETQATLNIQKLPKIQGYRTGIRLLFQNLMANALKFTHVGQAPEITISCKREPEQYKFLITDNGIGIAPEHKNKIFAIFQRLHERGKYEGTGIGLAHCEKTVNLHGGKIWVESDEGNGSTFYFTIPNWT